MHFVINFDTKMATMKNPSTVSNLGIILTMCILMNEAGHASNEVHFLRYI